MRAFVDYVGGIMSDDSLVQDLENAVQKILQQSKWREEYMLLSWKLQEERDEGHEAGLAEGRAEYEEAILANLREHGVDEATLQAVILETQNDLRESSIPQLSHFE